MPVQRSGVELGEDVAAHDMHAASSISRIIGVVQLHVWWRALMCRQHNATCNMQVRDWCRTNTNQIVPRGGQQPKNTMQGYPQLALTSWRCLS